MPEVVYVIECSGAQAGFALPIAEADDIGHIIAHCVLCGQVDTVGTAGAGRCDELDRCRWCDCTRPFQIQVRLPLVSRYQTRVATVNNNLRRVGRQVHAGAKLLDVGDDDVGSAEDGNRFPAAIDAADVQRFEIVDRLEIRRRQVMGATRRIVRR